jgi:probable HAF family extracellular repeat protein
MHVRVKLAATVVPAALLLAACQDTSTPLVTQPQASVETAATAYTVQGLPIPASALFGEANDINDAGVMAGWHSNSNVWSAVMWDAAGTTMTDLGKLPGFQSALAKGINNSGTIVGYVLAAGFAASKAFIWTPTAGMKALTGIGGSAGNAYASNNGGIAIGCFSRASGSIEAAKWLPNGSVVDINPPGAGYSEARAVNDLGDIVGVVVKLPKRERAYLWRHDGVEIDLGTLGGVRSYANAVNNSLAIVGVSERPFPLPPIAFGWRQTTGMKALTSWGGNSEALGLSDLNRAVGKQTISAGVLGLTQRLSTGINTLPDLANKGFPFSAATASNRCGTVVGSSVSPSPTSGNSVPVLWRKATCD